MSRRFKSKNLYSNSGKIGNSGTLIKYFPALLLELTARSCSSAAERHVQANFSNKYASLNAI